MPVYRLPTNQGPIARLLTLLFLAGFLVVVFLLGTVLFFTVLGLAVVLALVLFLRLWWLRRRWARQAPSRPQGGDILEGEFTVEDPARKKNLPDP